MRNAMTKEEKIKFLNNIEQNLMNESVHYVEGYNAYSEEVMVLLTEGVITPNIVDGAFKREWFDGLKDARDVAKIKHELKTQKVITFKDVLSANRKDNTSGCKINVMLYHGMFPTIENLNTNLNDVDFPLIKVQIIFEDDIDDGYRTREVGVVSYEGVDVMLYNCAGRDGYEYNDSFIVDKEKYIQAVAYIQKIILQNESDDVNVVGLEDDAEHLINFYGSRLEIVNNG